MLVLEFFRLVDEFMEWNARLMGYYISDQNYTMYILNTQKQQEFPPSIPIVCTVRPEGGCQCKPNLFLLDEMHWFLYNMNGRVYVSVECILGCVHNDIDNNKDKHFTGALQECENGATISACV